MTYITKNHKTTTVLVAIAALSAILVAGSVAAASDHFAFAHKKGFVNKGIAVPTITAQEQKCETAGGTATDSLGYVTVIGSPITGSCIATSTNTVTESGGAVK
jgi:hypothetical protein